MSDDSRPKFDWYYAMSADKRISDARRMILGYIAIRYVFRDEDTFCVKQDVIAKHFGVQRQTVGAALAQARDLGWLTATPRDRGRGHTTADRHWLTTPAEIGSPPQTSNDNEIGSPPKQIGSSPQTNRSVATNKIGSRTNSSTSENNPPLDSPGLRESHGLRKELLDDASANQPAAQTVAPGIPAQRAAPGDTDELALLPPIVAAAVKILRSAEGVGNERAVLTVSDVHGRLYGRGRGTQDPESGPARQALDYAVRLGLVATRRDPDDIWVQFWALDTEQWQHRRAS
jgi:hypothetical protein